MTGMMPTILGIVVMVAQVGVAALVAVVIYRSRKKRSAAIRGGSFSPGPDGATAIPLMASFAGVRGLPWWFAVATNNARPLLEILPSGLRYRVIRKRERSFSEIERVDVRTFWQTVNIDIAFRGALLTMVGNVGTLEQARAAVALFPPGVPLTARARAVLAGRTP
jgi:hypothetical protein